MQLYVRTFNKRRLICYCKKTAQSQPQTLSGHHIGQTMVAYVKENVSNCFFLLL